ncbi:MAG TPA: TonB-dependent receptor [Rhodocyclaceae bacterium]|jgi:iron complex outermembrane receptor protein
MKIKSLTTRPTPIALLVMTVLAAPPLRAAELELDPVVVTGSRSEHKSFDLPAAIDVVDANRIDAAQAKVNLSEALSAIPGITVSNRQNYAQDLQISSRGFGARSAFGVRGIKLITDGIPASTPDGQGQASTFNLDTAERIEVLRGPGSVLYGNNAGGVVQLFSRNPGKDAAVSANVSAGSYGSVKVDSSAEGHVGDVGYLFDASDFTTDGYRDHSAADRRQSYGKLLVPIGGDSLLTLIGSSMTQKDTQDPQGLNWTAATGSPRSVSQTTLDFNVRKSIEHQQAGATFERSIGTSTLYLSAYAGNRQVTQYQSIPKATQAPTTQAGGVIDYDRDFTGLALRWTQRDDLAGGLLTTTAGLDIDRASDDRKGYENFIGNTLGVKGALRRSETDAVTSTDPYLQTEWKRGTWQFSGGVRHSKVNFKVSDNFLSNGNDSGTVSYSKTTPTAAVLYQLNERTNVYASAGRGFEAPTFNELFYSGPGGTFSFNLQPATSRHLETGVKALIGDRTRINAALYRIDTDNEIVVNSNTGGRSAYKNAGRTLRTGIEVSLDTAWDGGYTGKLALNSLSATYEEDFVSNGTTVTAGKKLPGVADSSIFAELAWKGSNGLSAGLELFAQGRVYAEDTNKLGYAPGYAIANFRIGSEQKSGPWSLREYFRINNLFDRQYIGSVIVGDSNKNYYEPSPGQNWLIGASVRYSY